MSENNVLPQLVQHELPHFRQRHNWDCGISCVLMTLPEEKRKHFIAHFKEICREEGFNKSTWTIDLCYLMKRYSVPHTFYTVTIGIHPGYRDQSFYDTIIHKDEERVQKRFTEAANSGIRIRQSSLSHQDLLLHLAKSGPIILLTNANLLHCLRCRKKKAGIDLLSCLSWTLEYHGHYIVLCGYDLTSCTFYYRNPSCRDRMCEMSFESLNQSRLSYGTDEDAILIQAESWT